MRPAILALAALTSAVVGCGRPEAPRPTGTTPASSQGPDASFMDALAANRIGIGHLERFEYADAAAAFRKVRKAAPGWVPGSINLSIALLNDSGVKSEAAMKSGADAGAVSTNFDEALTLLDDVLKREPDNLYAHYCRGIILQFLQGDARHPENLVRAHDDFRAVTEGDPSDAHAWYRLAETMYDPATRDDPDGPRQAGPDQLPEKMELLKKALSNNPYLTAALHQLHLCYGQSGDRKTQTELMSRWAAINPQMNPAAPGEMIGNSYGEAGRYCRAIDPLPGPSVAGPLTLPRFGFHRAIDVKLPTGDRWAGSGDFASDLDVFRRARDRFGVACAAFDADGDGKPDLYLAGAVAGPGGLRDALLLNRGGGKFEDVSAAWKIPTGRVSLGVAAADFDADRRVDLYLTGVGDNRLLRNLGDRFEDVTAAAKVAGPGAISPTARWMDLDQDGDLDLYVVNYALASDARDAFRLPVAGLADSVYRNDGTPPKSNTPPDTWTPLAASTEGGATRDGLSIAFTPMPAAIEAGKVVTPHTGVAMLDIDDDRDIDIIISREGAAPSLMLNDRLGVFRPATPAGFDPSRGADGLLAADIDKDGRVDLVTIERGGKVLAWRNTSTRAEGGKVSFAPQPCDAKGWRSAVATDLDLDTNADLVGLSNSSTFGPSPWARNDGAKLVPESIPIGPDGTRATLGLAVADLDGDPLPDILTIRDGEAPRLATNLGNGRTWVALGLGGRWKTSFDHMRTNSEGLGTRIRAEGPGLDVAYSQTTPDSGPAQSAGRVVLGLGVAKEVTLLHLSWPDGVLQCELNLPADAAHDIPEYNRKTGSCPVLFTWNGERFVCLGDFLGGGGMGYLVAPGVYGQPDRDESVAIAPDQLKAVDGRFRVAIAEPMDELAYLDELTLEVVDRPPGVDSTPDERFAPVGPRPTGDLVVWSKSIRPVKATGGDGRDLTEALRAWDRATADGFRLLKGWIGYAEEHSVVLDFGDRLESFGPADRLTLCLAGWVEYPYSQTNYAAATAGTILRAPILERLGEDGTWKVIDPYPGYPAGMPRRMTVDLTGKVGGPRAVLRLRTNMECYWDEAFVAVREDAGKVRTTRLPVDRASLEYRGYMREVSPDGKLPLLYDHEYVDPAPLARLSGNLTRFGDVAPLLRADDDQLCLVGPGDEARVEFDASRLPPLPVGWTRSYVLRSIGYCKDADPFTATSDDVGPLPWKGMPPFPFVHGERRPVDPAYARYLSTYQTRPAGAR